ncbi:phosphate ABC transporter substrate-binding protein [Tengunoibacter tsumagoiensis]|uniref:PBP domain-containing protein n=1 Tax=Tengunoibacter tsumagoiensis TaxID=2014871 RepID=A0A401ZW09_9CHLR|nr:phosphate ABC transporter substrate-binding protein [Tengunoibacter tsumagoiensis]GCE11085.1 hypothetical protein KTT_09440 [Tengunoibacter tsumagoiensis]
MLNKWRIGFVCAAFAALSVFATACGASTGADTTATPTPTPAPAKAVCTTGAPVLAAGSTALQPLAQDVATEYQKQCAGTSITVNGGGSSTGLANASNGSAQIGDSDVFADATKYPGLVDHKVAVVVFAILINDKVTGVTNLTSDQLKGIYTGTITNWKEVGGPDLKIVAVSRSASSGTRQTFEKFIIQTKENNTAGITAASSGDVANAVKQTDGAIAYDTTDFAINNSLTTIKIDGAENSDANVKTDKYKFWGFEHMYTKGEATGLVKSYIDYISSTGADSFRKTRHFVNVADLTPAAVTAKTPAA